MKKGTTTTVPAAKTNLFAKAKGETKAKTPKKDDKETVELKDPDFYETLARYSELNEEEKTIKAEKEGLYAEIKEKGIEQMAAKYDKDGKFPGSFNIKAIKEKESASFMFITQDSYAKIDEERAEELKKKFGESIIKETTTFSLRSDLVEKYSQVLSDLISNSKDITDEDKDELIQAATVISVAPGTIENLKSIKGKNKTSDILEEIVPTFQVKGVKKDK